ncbi:glutaminase A [Haloactinopolyspora sp.]|uniref:glutaminase A n=1 Tax=Haloactinopolyspora sp. TaxID=1966353 RepID=UPI0026176261|nr:glutaminase A [Haloactinopolyspora sp.]
MPDAEQTAIVHEQTAQLHAKHRHLGHDQVISFYPPRMRAQAHLFGVAYTHVDGTRWNFGDWDYPFPLQSIAKVFIHALALQDNGREGTLRHVGVEPSGDPFYEITFDETNNRPFNPMINAGALVTTSLIHGDTRDEKVARLLQMLRTFSGNHRLQVDEETLARELESNDRNLALSYLMRSLGMLTGDVYDNLVVYLSACSVKVTGRELADMGATLANGGVHPVTGQRALPRALVRDVATVMLMCGMYTAAGQWAYDVGIPAKSGVSGGLLVVLPNRFGAGFFSPGLDRHGNSVRAVNMCRDLSNRLGLHVFADSADTTFGRREPVDADQALRREPTSAGEGAPRSPRRQRS